MHNHVAMNFLTNFIFTVLTQWYYILETKNFKEIFKNSDMYLS